MPSNSKPRIGGQMIWRCFCEMCEHEWTVDLPEGEDIDSEGVQCPNCDTDLVSGVIVGA